VVCKACGGDLACGTSKTVEFRVAEISTRGTC